SAATFIQPWTVNPTTGAISVVIGDTGLGVAGGSSSSQGTSTQSVSGPDSDGIYSFTDTFSFSLPTGTIGSSVTSSDTTNHLMFTGFTFNGVNGMIGPTPAGLPSAGITAQFVTEGGQQQLIVSGSGGPAAGFGGTVNFAPVAGGVPEPAAWALMVFGVGGLGGLLRRQRRGAFAAA
ncbi:MAG: FxDxF family PEP-CTERM protein, partial [Proteobacteria bacterium]|nr:FxDxF family PEP-CTERM protein [Pseudomonadota bacterium]